MSMTSDLPENLASPELHRTILTRVRATTVRQLIEQVKTQFVPQLLSVGVVAGLSWQTASRLHLAFWVGTQLLVVYGLDEDYWQTYRQKVESVTPQDCHRVAIELIEPDRLLVLLTGDAEKLRDSLEAAAVGPVEVIAAD